MVRGQCGTCELNTCFFSNLSILRFFLYITPRRTSTLEYEQRILQKYLIMPRSTRKHPDLRRVFTDSPAGFGAATANQGRRTHYRTLCGAIHPYIWRHASMEIRMEACTPGKIWKATNLHTFGRKGPYGEHEEPIKRGRISVHMVPVLGTCFDRVIW
jgi:hypothetical protein